jgi:hypothetical protein
MWSLQYLAHRFSIVYERIVFLAPFKLSLVGRHGWANTKLQISKKLQDKLTGLQLYLTIHIYEIGEGSPDQQFEL